LERLAEAWLLCKGGKFDGAFYPLGNAVGLMLKARTCRLFDFPNLFDDSDKESFSIEEIDEVRRALKIHDLQTLLIFSDLTVPFDVKKETDPECEDIFSGLICEWNERSRYRSLGSSTENDVCWIVELLGDHTKVFFCNEYNTSAQENN
jgi:hypothetical protein